VVKLHGRDEGLAHDLAVDVIEDAAAVAVPGHALDALDGGAEAVAGDLVLGVLVAGPLLDKILETRKKNKRAKKASKTW
jgi:hypothetical protein